MTVETLLQSIKEHIPETRNEPRLLNSLAMFLKGANEQIEHINSLTQNKIEIIICPKNDLKKEDL